MKNERGNPNNAEYVILGTDPTAPKSDPEEHMKYPFGLPEYENVIKRDKGHQNKVLLYDLCQYRSCFM